MQYRLGLPALYTNRLCRIIFVLSGFLCCAAAPAQTVFWQDNFENTTTPDIAAGSIRTAENNGGTGGPPNTSYFKRTNGSDISMSIAYSGYSNTFFWAGEDHDTPYGAGNEEQQIEWTGINISGKTNISFRGFFGANSTSGSWDNFTTGSGAPGYGVFASPGNDYIIVQYAIDAGAYTNLVSFFGDDITGPVGTAKRLKEDTNGDFIGDGTILNQAMTEITKNIPGTGTTLKIRIRVFSNGGNEEWGIDNFRLLAGNPLPVTLSQLSGTVTNTGIALQWQTASEINSQQFVVEKSTDALQYQSIGAVQAGGTPSGRYAFTDTSFLFASRYYYRLKMIDKNGSYSYSPVISITPGKATNSSCYPNPAVNTLYICSAGQGTNTNSIKLFSVTGMLLYHQKDLPGYMVLNIEKYPAGMYWLQVNDEPLQQVIKSNR